MGFSNHLYTCSITLFCHFTGEVVNPPNPVSKGLKFRKDPRAKNAKFNSLVAVISDMDDCILQVTIP
jgi:hypothetical protein